MRAPEPTGLSSWYGRLVEHPEADAALAAIAEAAGDPASRPTGLDLARLPQLDRALLEDILGTGEVTVWVGSGAGRPAIFQEGVLPGVWRQLAEDGREGAQERAEAEAVEVALIPRAVERALARETRSDVPQGPASGGMAAAILSELAAHRPPSEPVGEAHVVNLAQLPLGPWDYAALERLGSGPVAMRYRGYGECYVAATGVRDVWRVQHFNALGTLVMDSLEVTGVPSAAQATEEDLCSTAERVAELRQVLR